MLAQIKMERAQPRFSGLSPWLRGLDLNQRPLGYEPNELPDCSTPRCRLIRYWTGCIVSSATVAPDPPFPPRSNVQWAEPKVQWPSFLAPASVRDQEEPSE